MSQRDIATHVKTGELRQTGTEFVCNICSSPLGQQPMQHIQGSTHKNAVFLKALSQPIKYKALYSALPKVVRQAHGKGVVTVKDSKFKCGPCNMVFTGEIPLTDHLSSSKHLTKAAGQVSPTVLTPPAAGPSTAQPTFPGVNKSGSSGQTPAGQPNLMHRLVAKAVRDGHVKATGSTAFQCTLCPGTKVITGVEPMRQHLEGKLHKKSLQQDPCQLPFNRINIEQIKPVNVQRISTFPSSGQAPAGVDYPYGFDAGPVPIYSTAMGEVGGLVAELFGQTREQLDNMEAPEQFGGIIGGLFGQTFQRVKNMPALGRLLDDSSNPTQQTSWSSVTSYEEPEPPVEEVLALVDTTPYAVGRTVPTPNMDGRWQPKSPYKIESSPRGIVVIFNYYFEGQGEIQRDGAEADYRNLRNVFTNMDYEVWPELIDLTKHKTMETLDDISSSQKLAMVDSFIAFFLSHGGDSPYSFRTVDGKIISVEEIYTKFTDSNCPQLRRKPKLFFFNFCRGKTEQLQSDSWKPNSSAEIAPRHVAVIQAALPHFEAKRDTEKGTVFVDCLCEVLSESANSLELHDIVHNTSELMQERGGTTATPWYIDFGKFYFL